MLTLISAFQLSPVPFVKQSYYKPKNSILDFFQVPERAPAGEKSLLTFSSTFLETVLLVNYSKGIIHF